jgi:hypothetical protein
MYQKVLRPLDPYLALAALLPFEQKMSALEDASPEQISDLNMLWGAAMLRPEEIDRPPFIFKSGGTQVETSALRYQLFLIVRDCLRSILEVVAQGRPENDGPSLNYYMDSISPLEQRWCGLFNDGIRIFNDPQQIFLNCLELTGEEIWNLRPCPVCSTPFLPRRADQKACSLNCSNTYRLRNHRSPDKDRLGKQKRPATPVSWKRGIGDESGHSVPASGNSNPPKVES